MTSINHDFAETDPATEALILQLIAQDFGQEVPQTLLGTNSGSDHQEGNPHWDNQGSNSQWDIQDSNNQCDNSGSDIGEDQILEPSDSQTALPVGQEDSHSSCSDSSERIIPDLQDHNLEEMTKRIRENEDLEPDGDATGSGVPVYANSYHPNDNLRPSENTSNKRAKVDNNAADRNTTLDWASLDSGNDFNSHPQSGGVAVQEHIDEDAPGHDHNMVTENPTDADNTAQAFPAAAGTTDWGEDANDSEDYEGDSEGSEGESYDEEDELGDLDAMDALSIRDDGDEGSADSNSESESESEDEGVDPPSKHSRHPATLRPATYRANPPATLRPVTYNPNQAVARRPDTYNTNDERRTPVVQIPWPGIPGWMESYVYENSGHTLDDDDGGLGGRHRRGGPTLAQMLQNQQRMSEEEPVDVILEEHETADWLIGEMVKKEEQAKREAKGKGKAVD